MQRRPKAQTARNSGFPVTLLAAAVALPACSGESGTLGAGQFGAPVGQPQPVAPAIEQPVVVTEVGQQAVAPEPVSTPTPTTPTDLGLFRLTRVQYGNTVKAFTGVDPELDDLPTDLTPGGFANLGTSVSNTGNAEVSQFDVVASDVATRLFADRALAEKFVGCAPAQANAACVADFLETRLPEAFRRPVSPEELARYQSVVDTVAEDQEDIALGLQFATATMMQSPNFVYRVEQTVPDAASPTGTRYDSHSMASRLSYLLADSAPDAELRAAALADALGSQAEVVSQAERLLALPSAVPALTRYFADWFDLHEVEELGKDAELFPEFNAELRTAMRTELELMFKEFAFNPAQDYSELLTTRRAYVNDVLAELYDIDPALPRDPVDGAEGFFTVTLPDSDPRAGLLTRGAILALHSRATDTSSTLRGIMVRTQVLCQEIPSAPADVNTDIVPSDEIETQRQELERHRDNPACAACHAFIDPLGFGLENFDPVGRYRETVLGGLVIDASGDVDGVNFNTAAEMGQALRDNPRSSTCIVQKFTEHALSRKPSTVTIAQIDDEYTQQGKSFQALVMGLVKSSAFRFPVQ